MVDFFLYRSCDLTDLGVRQILARNTDVIDRGIAILEEDGGVPADPAPGSDNPTLDIVTAEWGEPTDGGGQLPPGTYDYSLVPVDTCTGRTGEPIVLPPLVITGVPASGTIAAVSEALITDGDTFVLNDGVNPAVTFVFDKLGSNATGSIDVPSGVTIVDGDTFVLNDGVNPAVTFEFDDNGSVVETATLRAIDLGGSETTSIIANLIVAAINASPTHTGAAASMAAVAANVITVTGLTGMTAASVGRILTITGADTGANNGSFVIVTFNSATSVDITAGAAPGNDLNNGALTWTERVLSITPLQNLDRISLTNDLIGAQGNQTITQGGSAPLVVSGMTGGAGVNQTATLRRIALVGNETSTNVASFINSAIANTPTLDITATLNGSTVDLVNDVVGPVGNIAITQGGSAPLTVTGMAGGSGLGRVAQLRIQFGELPGGCDAAQLRRDDIVVGPVFSLDDIPQNVTVVSQPNRIGDYDTIDASPGQILKGGKAGFRRQGGADLIGGDVIRYNNFTVRVTQVIGSAIPQTVLFAPPIPATLVEPEGFYDSPNRTGFYDAVSTMYNPYTQQLGVGFGAITQSYAPVFAGTLWGGPTMSFKTVPNHVRFPLPFIPFFNDIQPGDIIVFGSKTALVVYVESSPLAVIDPLPAAGTVLVLPFGILPIPPLPVGQFWIVYRSLNPPQIGSAYSMYNQPAHGEGPPSAGDTDQGYGDPTGASPGTTLGDFRDFDDVGPTALRGGVAADGGSGSGFATGTIVTDVTGNDEVLVLDGETMIIDDGTVLITFEFDDDGSVIISPTLRPIDISTATTSVDVQNAIISAINAAPFTVNATAGALNVVQLKNSVPAVGGTLIVSTVASAFFTIAGMTISTPAFNEFLDKDAYNPGQPLRARHRLNAFRVLGNGQGGVGPPTALKNGAVIIYDATVVTVNEVTELIPPGGFPGTPLPGFPGTYEIEFMPDLAPNPQVALPGSFANSRPMNPVSPWVVLPSLESPYLIQPQIDAIGQYERLTRQNQIEQRTNLWQFQEDGASQGRAGDVDGSEAEEELDQVFVQNNYPGGLDGLLETVRGSRETPASNVFVVTNGTMTFISPRLIPCNPLVEIGNGITIDLRVIRDLITDTCDDITKLFAVTSALASTGFAILRKESREVQIPAASCPPGTADAREVRLFCLDVATATNGLRAAESAQVYFRQGSRTTAGIRSKLISHGLSEDEADAALQLTPEARVLGAIEIQERSFENIPELQAMGSASDIQDVLNDQRIEVINTGTITRQMIGENIRNRGDAGILKRFPGTDPIVGRDPQSKPIDDFILPMHRLAGLALTLQSSFDVCDYEGALASIPDPNLRAQMGAYFAVVEGLLNELLQAGRAITDFMDNAPGFKEALDAIGGIVSGSDGDPTLSCLIGPQAPGIGGVPGSAGLSRLNDLMSLLAPDMQIRFNLSQLFGQAIVSVLCSTISALNSVLGLFGVNTSTSFAQRAIGCLPSIEDLQSAGVEFPSLESQIAFECSLEQLNILLDIINALIAEANEVIDFANALDSGFVTRAIEARNRMCSGDEGLASLLGGLRAFIGLG